MKWSWRLIPILLFLLLVLFLWQGLSIDPHQLPSVQVGKALPEFHLRDLDSKQSFNSKDLPHRVFLLNIWASWCEVCEKEQLVLMKLANQGVLIYGINYKDNPTKAKSWLNQWGNPFQRVGLDSSGALSIELGVYGVPETFVIDKKGIIRYRHVGYLSEESWRSRLGPLIEQLEKA